MLELIKAPAFEPLSQSEVRMHCRATEAEDELLALYLTAAVQAVQGETGRALLRETWRASLPAWPCAALTLTRAPLLAVTEVRYWAAGPADAVLATDVYQVSAPKGPHASPGSISLVPGESWPGLGADRADAVRITYDAGYGDEPGDVPAPLRAAVLLMVGSMYEFREADATRVLTENPAVSRLLAPYRIMWI